jgi:hypothetical protein
MRPLTGRKNQDDVPKGVSVQRQGISGEVNFCFGFDDEEGVGVGVA